MMRILVVLMVFGVLAIGTVRAQSVHTSYIGVGAAIIPAPGFIIPLLSLQAGTPIVDFLEARLKLDSILLFNLIEADLLVTLPVGSGFKPYLGVGAGYFFNVFGGYVATDATVGAEYMPGSIGYFGEARAAPSALLNGVIKPFYRFRFNFHF